MHNKDAKTGIILFILFVLPLTLYFLFRNSTTAQFEPVPRAYTILNNGDSLFHKLPIFSFIDQKGNVFDRERMLGNIYILSFMSLEDTLKTKILNSNLKRIHDNIEEGANIRIVSIHMDSTSLVDYAATMEINPDRWAFVYGRKAEVYRIAKDAFHMPEFASMDSTSPPFTPLTVALIDKEGNVRKYYPGTDLGQIRPITDDLRSLIVMEYPEELKK